MILRFKHNSVSMVLHKQKLLEHAFFLSIAILLGGCGMLKEQNPDSSDGELDRLAIQATQKPMPPEKSKELINEVGSNWLYGQGVGETALNIGTVVAFPPYALYLLGNAALSLSGYEPIEISDALPNEERDEWHKIYNGVTEGPGRMSAALAGEEFRNKEVATEGLKRVLEPSRDSDTRAQLGIN